MAWEIVKRDDTFQGRNTAHISIGHDRILFNALFAKIADLDHYRTVKIYADQENLRLGFEFLSEESQDSLMLIKSKGTISCSARGNVQKYPWVKSITKLPKKHKRFKPYKEGKLWVIQLCPAFEHRKARESVEISDEAKGIYRYLRENNEIVYIGRGAIKKRLNAPERKEWDFDIVEFSIIEDPDQQVKWEDYWINRFREDNRGHLPLYNKISGTALKIDSES